MLGKRKSSERDSHLSDDGYCTCGSSCDSTPSSSSSSSTTAIGQVAAPMSCIYHSKVKRKEIQSVEHQLVSEGGCSSDTYTSASEGRRKESGCMGSGAEVRKPMAAKSSNADVNQILADFDRICESPEAVAALQLEERQPKPSMPTTPTIAIDYRPAEQLRSLCPTPEVPRLVETKPAVSLVTDSTVSSSTGEEKMPDLELEIEMAKKEDEELKKAMEESLKQQVNIENAYHVYRASVLTCMF